MAMIAAAPGVLVGIIGAGAIVRSVHLPVLKAMSNVDIAWITDANFQHAKSVGSSYGIPFMQLPASLTDLPVCDAVLLAVPLSARRPYYEYYANKGVGLLAEKPFAINAEDHEQFLEGYPNHLAGCGYMRRMYANHRLLRRAVSGGWFGPLRRITVSDGGRTTRSGFDRTYQDLGVASGGGVLLNIGSHAIDSAFFITEATGYSITDSDVTWDGDTDRRAEADLTLHTVMGEPGYSCEFRLCVSWLDPQTNTVELEFDHLRVSGPTVPGADVTLHVSKTMTNPEATMKLVAENAASTTNQAFYLEWVDFLRGLDETKASEIAAFRSLVTARVIDDLLGGRNKREAALI